MKAHQLLFSSALALVIQPYAFAGLTGSTDQSAPQQKTSGQGESQEELRRRTLEGESRAEMRAKMGESLRPVNAAYERAAAAEKRWQEGHHREAFTMMFAIHRELNELRPREGKKGEPRPGFDLLTGRFLAQMSDEMGETTEAYELYKRLIHPPEWDRRPAERRVDILMSFSEVCRKLKKEKEARWAFDQIAKGDLFTSYFWAAEEASSLGRWEVAERWVRKALEVRPNDKEAKARLSTLLKIKARGVRSHVG